MELMVWFLCALVLGWVVKNIHRRHSDAMRQREVAELCDLICKARECPVDGIVWPTSGIVRETLVAAVECHTAEGLRNAAQSLIDQALICASERLGADRRELAATFCGDPELYISLEKRCEASKRLFGEIRQRAAALGFQVTGYADYLARRCA